MTLRKDRRTSREKSTSLNRLTRLVTLGAVFFLPGAAIVSAAITDPVRLDAGQVSGTTGATPDVSILFNSLHARQTRPAAPACVRP